MPDEEKMETQTGEPEEFAYVFETEYTLKALTAMTRVLRKTVRKKHSIRTHIFGWIVVALALLLTIPRRGEFHFTMQVAVTWIAMLAVILVFLFEDKLNARVARRRMLPGMTKSRAFFGAEIYRSENAVGVSEFPYAGVNAIVEYGDYFVFTFGKNHAQVYDMRGMTPADPDGFRAFMQEKTGKTITKVK